MFERTFLRNALRSKSVTFSSGQPPKKPLASPFGFVRANLKPRNMAAFGNEPVKNPVNAPEASKQVPSNHAVMSKKNVLSKPLDAGSRVCKSNSETINKKPKERLAQNIGKAISAASTERLSHITYSMWPTVVAISTTRPEYAATAGTNTMVSKEPSPNTIKIRVAKEKSARQLPQKKPQPVKRLKTAKAKAKLQKRGKTKTKSRSTLFKSSKTGKKIFQKRSLHLKKAIKMKAVAGAKVGFRARVAKKTRGRKTNKYIEQWRNVVKANLELKKAICATIKQLTEDAVLANKRRMQLKRLKTLPAKKPSKPPSAFLRFVAAERAATPRRRRQEYIGWLSNINAKWLQLSAEDRAVYEQQEREAMQTYQAKVAIWEAKLDQLQDTS